MSTTPTRRYFGTDGVRGVANQKLTPEFALSLGLAVGAWIQENGASPRVVIGRDTRQSGPMLEAALTSGLCSMGVEVVSAGVVPTPTVSFLTRNGDFAFGVVISASHNPAPDNGIKFITSEGTKATEAMEADFEARMASPQSSDRPVGAGVGTARSDASGVEGYLAMLKAIVPQGLAGMRVAVDAANGAAFELGPEILRRLGAEVHVFNAAPDGSNINTDCGATNPETIQRLTVESGADIGVAFDGDADRAVFSDNQGRLINGDRTIGIWATHMKKQGRLDPPVIVGTVMSNGGFEAHMTQNGIKLERTPVGDKYVSARISETGALVGGEQSGHIVFPAHGPSGDGLATMLELFGVIRAEGRSSAEFFDDYRPWPQLLVNVGVASTENWEQTVAEELARGHADLAGHGRLLVRASGTQPMIRVMAEADEYALRDKVVDEVVAALVEKLDGHVHGRVDLTYALGD